MSLSIIAQDIEVKKFEPLEKDQTAALSPRKDINGVTCGLVKVLLKESGAEFEGSVMGEVQFIGNLTYIRYKIAEILNRTATCIDCYGHCDVMLSFQTARTRIKETIGFMMGTLKKTIGFLWRKTSVSYVETIVFARRESIEKKPAVTS